MIFLDFKVYFHRTYFGFMMHRYVRKFLKLMFFVWGLFLIWIFGNNLIFTFTFPKENPKKINGVFSENGEKFEVIGTNEVKIPRVFEGYIAHFWDRATSSPLSLFILSITFLYILLYFIVSLSIFFIRKLRLKNLKKNFKNLDTFLKKFGFGKSYWNYHFEDLVSKADILYTKCLEQITVEDKETENMIKKMHYERNKRAWRNLVRENKRLRGTTGNLKTQPSHNDHVNITGDLDDSAGRKVPKFKTTSSYDYKVIFNTTNFLLDSSEIPYSFCEGYHKRSFIFRGD